MKGSITNVFCICLSAYLSLCHCTPKKCNKDGSMGTDINVMVSEVDVLTNGTDSICTILCYLEMQNLTPSQISIEGCGDDNFISDMYIDITHISLRHKEIITYPNFQNHINPNESIKMAVYFENFTYSELTKRIQSLSSIKECLIHNGILVRYKYNNVYNKLNVSMASTPIYVVDDFM